MKNRIKLYIFIMLCLAGNLQYAYAQVCPEASGYTVGEYNQEISDRLQIADFWLSSINIDLEQSTNGTPINYVILNDKDFYGGNTGGYGQGCQWPFIDGVYDAPPNINTITYFILTPGDYRDYLDFQPRFNNSTPSLNDKKYLLHYPGSPNDSPQVIENYLNGISETPKAAVDQAEYERAIIEDFRILQDGWSWVVRGITIRGNHNSRLDDENGVYGTGSSTSEIQTNQNIIESCLFENQVKGNFINISNGDRNIIHNCVIRDQNDCMITYLAGNDIIGVNIKAKGSAAQPTAFNNYILNNKIYNVTDAIQLSANSDYIGDMPGTFIYGNELYNEKIYTDNCGEERMNGEGAIDVKRGTGDGEEVADITDKVIIANNLFYGWRRAGTEGLGRIFDGRTKDCVDLATHPADGDCFHDANGRGGGAGDAITFHLTASNVAVINNTVTDCTNGFQIGGSGGQIEVYDNTICNLYTPHDAYIGDSGNGSYWTNTIYPQNFWYTSGQGVCYDLPSCLASWQCANAPNTYRVNHQVGLAIKSSMESSRISGNKIKKAINGIRLDGTSGRKAVVTRNYIEDILTENLAFPDSNNDGNPDDDCLYEYFYGNTYSDFTNVCWGNGNSFPANKVIENNCFLYCSGYVMGTGTFSCEANCN